MSSQSQHRPSSPSLYDYAHIHANPPTNYIGTALFLIYITLALLLTGYVAWDLYTRCNTLLISRCTPTPPTPETKSKNATPNIDIRSARARHIEIYALFASVSFAVLSFHMLNFLMHSYEQWAVGRRATIPTLEVSLKAWVLATSLFESFAKELVGDGPSSLWAQVGVLGTWFWTVWMGEKANERGFGAKRMLPYILLSQILPISFSAALFLIDLHLASPDLAHLFASSDPQNKPAPKPTPAGRKKTSPILPTILLNALLLSLAPLRTHYLFVTLVLFTRFLLLLPFTGRISARDAQVGRCLIVSTGFVVGNLMMLKRGYNVSDILKVLRGKEYGGYAVRTFAWDALISTVLGWVANWGGGV